MEGVPQACGRPHDSRAAAHHCPHLGWLWQYAVGTGGHAGRLHRLRGHQGARGCRSLALRWSKGEGGRRLAGSKQAGAGRAKGCVWRRRGGGQEQRSGAVHGVHTFSRALFEGLTFPEGHPDGLAFHVGTTSHQVRSRRQTNSRWMPQNPGWKRRQRRACWLRQTQTRLPASAAPYQGDGARVSSH